MPENTLPPFEQATAEIPVRRRELLTFLQIATGAVITYTACITTLPHDSLPLHLISGATYLIGAVADNKSTIRGLRASEVAEETEIPNRLKETAFILPHIRTAKDLKKSKAHWISELAAFGVAVIYSPLAVTGGATRLFVATNNRRFARRLELAVEIAKTHEEK